MLIHQGLVIGLNLILVKTLVSVLLLPGVY
jgi:hypothetical protein